MNLEFKQDKINKTKEKRIKIKRTIISKNSVLNSEGFG